MTDLKKSRSLSNEELSKSYGDLEVLIAEDDYDEIISQRKWMKTLYVQFRDAHVEYHETLLNEVDISASNAYFRDTQKLYATQQNAAKAALNEVRHEHKAKQEMQHGHSFETLSNLMHLPPLELKKFSGEPDEFDDFMTTFNEVIGNVVTSPAARLVRLKSQLSGSALDSIRMCRTDSGDDGYARALKILHDRFGSRYIVCNSIIERLKHGPIVRTPAELRTLSDELANAEVTLKDKKMYSEIDTQNNIVEICLRLEPCLRYKWRNQIMKNKASTGVYLDFSDFVKFVQVQADIVNDPLYGKDALEDHSSKGGIRKSVSSLPVAVQNAGNSNSTSDPSATLDVQSSSGIQCHLCLKNHKLYTCYKFRNMSINERYDYVKTNKLCNLCLGKDHLVSNCRSTYTCKVDNCGERHSSSLHLYNKQSPAVTGLCVQSFSESNVYMPTMPVSINGTFQTFALLDTGSSTSFCSRRLVNELKLHGATTSYQLRTLHGSNNSCSEVVSFHVSSQNGTASLMMHNVLVVDEIPVERCNVHATRKYTHLKDLNFMQASQVDILIGQDNSEALMPIEVRRGAEGSPFAVRTMLGWSLNGCVSTNVPSGRVTSNFVSANILDLKLKLPGNETTVHVEFLRASVEEQEYSVVNQYPNTVVNLERVTQNNLYIVIHRMAITLFMLFLLGCNICLCMFSLFNFYFGCYFMLEACYASTGGVLSLLDYVSYIVPSYMSICTVSHLITVAFYDAR